MNRRQIQNRSAWREGNYYGRPIGKKGRWAIDYSHPMGDDQPDKAVFSSEGAARHYARIMRIMQEADPRGEAWLLRMIHDRRHDLNDPCETLGEHDQHEREAAREDGELDCPVCGERPEDLVSLAH